MFGDYGLSRTETVQAWTPVIEVSEREGNFIIHAELPGLQPEDVKVEISKEGLVIQGERKSVEEQNRGGVYRSERRYGRFYRVVPLPENVSPDQVKAKFQHGVLEITAPVTQTQPDRREIPIQTDSGAGSPQQASQSQLESQPAQAASA